MSNYELFAKIGGDSSGLQRAMGNAQKSIGRTSERFAKLRAAGLLAFKGLAAGATAAAGTFTALTVSGLRMVDSQAKLARSIGASIDGLKGLQIAAGDAGVEAGALGTAMQMMNARLAEAARGGNASAKAIERMGLDANELVNMDIDERIATMADRMLELGFTAAQAQDELNQLGIRNRQLALLMIQGGDAIRAARQEVDDYGLSISAIEAGNIERANDAFSRLGRLTEAIRIELAVQLAPLIERVSKNFNEMARSSGGLRDVVRPAIQGIIEAIGVLGDSVLEAHRAFLELRIVITSLIGDFDRFKRVADFLNPLRPVVDGLKAGFGLFGDAVGDGNEEVQALKTSLDALAERGAFSRWINETYARLSLLNQEIGQVPEMLRRIEGSSVNMTQDPGGVVGPQIFPDFVPSYIKGFEQITDAAEKASINIAMFMEQAGANIQNAFAQFLFDPFKDGLKGMLRSFINIIRQMVAQIMAAQVLTAFFGQFAGQAGFMGSIASGMGIQAPAATPTPGLAIGGRATGGPVMANTPYMVGERGPELVVPSKSGYVVPNNKLGGGGGVSLNVNINAEDPGAEGRIRTMIERDMAPQIIQAAMGRTMNSLRRPAFA